MPPFLLLLGLSLLPGAGEPTSVEDLAPHAAGICLAEVVNVKNFDYRASDGPAGVQVELKILRGSGAVRKEVYILTEYGGAGPPGRPEKPKHGPVGPNSLKKREKYWLAFASGHEELTSKYPEGVINFWPENSPRVAKLLEAAIRADEYRWKPEYDPMIGLSCGYLIEADKRQWRIRVEKQGKVLWEKVIPGSKAKRTDSWDFWDGGYNGFPAEMPRSGKILNAESAQALDAKNEFALPAGTYYVKTAFDPETGQRLAAWVTVHQDPYVDLVHREYDPKPGKVRREDRYDWLDRGGRAVGAAEERWWRKTSRVFDGKSGDVTREEVFRYDERQQEDRWVRIKPAK